MILEQRERFTGLKTLRKHSLKKNIPSGYCHRPKTSLAGYIKSSDQTFSDIHAVELWKVAGHNPIQLPGLTQPCQWGVVKHPGSGETVMEASWRWLFPYHCGCIGAGRGQGLGQDQGRMGQIMLALVATKSYTSSGTFCVTDITKEANEGLSRPIGSSHRGKYFFSLLFPPSWSDPLLACRIQGPLHQQPCT